ncbi:type II secretion system protein [Halanaerobium congolense]|jgi:prepilin-type N-terminal cleavage/methylation domain-containing protein
MNSKKHGFTLIELLVVITILSILSGIVVPIISGVSD